MIFIPLPFVVALLLAVCALRYSRAARERGDEALPFTILMSLFALQSVIVGLRWAYDLVEIQPLMAAMASVLPPVAFLAFRGLVDGRTRPGSRDLVHAIVPLTVLLLLAVWRDWIGAVVILDFAGYGAAVLALSRGGPDALVASRLDGVVRSHHALVITGCTLIASALSDVLISLDVSFFEGRHSAAIVSTGTTVSLAVLSLAVAFVDPPRDERAALHDEAEADGPAESPEKDDTPAASLEDQEIAAALDRLMGEEELYRDVELNLVRLARRLRKPARTVSRAVNRAHGVSVSQYVNGFRVRAAQNLLRATDQSVIQIAFEAGFMTKSNFNREFLRVAGCSPTRWRGDVAGKRT